MKSNQVLRNSLDNNTQLLRVEKKENEILKQQLQMLKNEKEGEGTTGEKFYEL